MSGPGESREDRVTRSRGLRAAAAAAMLVAGLAGCSNEAPDTRPETGAVTDISVQPGTTEDYVGAKQDVTGLACEPDGRAWKVTGTVRNSTRATAGYRIYTSFLDDENETRGLLQTDVQDLAPGGEKEWTGRLDVRGQDLRCVLRVERLTSD